MTDRELIEAAFCGLPLRKGRKGYLQSVISIICAIDCAGPGKAPRRFEQVGRTKTRNELEKLAHPGSDLVECFNALHEPAILALAKFGFCREQGKPPEKLRAIAKKAAESDLSWVPETIPGGRPQNRCAHAIATMLAYYYEMLTGKKPTRSVDPYKDSDSACGPFIDLVKNVFKALGIRVNAEDIARSAIKRRKKLKKKRNSSRRVSSIIKK